ncbi:hypothetical protein NADFUDRAFT_82549 [Nadsonia fulvescens var. elongata DSM 6958]|uniref:C2H2-type domain-containing protein n=1 Tax=Nadsonia fulvescens var. elongata DSM 6958 TaxID=857566 RepID=A0A1E3PNI8_9ASCO|nr:hypothetical protein NADFUDRAFT_82549 [Nadsonia fulvescens var. elongata DSM 6958]
MLNNGKNVHGGPVNMNRANSVNINANNTHNESNSIQCYDCSQVFSSTSSLRRHEKIAHNKTMYKCRKCGELFSTVAERQTHKNNKHFPVIHTTIRGKQIRVIDPSSGLIKNKNLNMATPEKGSRITAENETDISSINPDLPQASSPLATTESNVTTNSSVGNLPAVDNSAVDQIKPEDRLISNFKEFEVGLQVTSTRDENGYFHCPSIYCSFVTRIPGYWYEHVHNVVHLGTDPQKRKRKSKIEQKDI